MSGFLDICLDLGDYLQKQFFIKETRVLGVSVGGLSNNAQNSDLLFLESEILSIP